MTTEHALLVLARYRCFDVSHEDGTNEQVDYDGTSPTALSYDVNHYAYAVWMRLHKQWNVEACRTWCRAATVVEQRGWRVCFFNGSEWHEGEKPTTWWMGMPGEAIVQALNRLAEEGWHVLHVSEDHGVYAGVDTVDESFPTRVRYLLRREPSTTRRSGESDDAVAALASRPTARTA